VGIFGPFTNAFVSINSVDLSNRVKSVQINYNAAMLDATAMSNTTKVNLAGLKDWSMPVTFVDEIAAAAVDGTLFGLVGAAAITVIMRPDAGAASATNPNYTGSAVLAGTQIGGAHGSLLGKTVTFQCAGALARNTT
jgi:hypothetical protein